MYSIEDFPTMGWAAKNSHRKCFRHSKKRSFIGLHYAMMNAKRTFETTACQFSPESAMLKAIVVLEIVGSQSVLLPDRIMPSFMASNVQQYLFCATFERDATNRQRCRPSYPKLIVPSTKHVAQSKSDRSEFRTEGRPQAVLP
jgi:hypothetical protein